MVDEGRDEEFVDVEWQGGKSEGVGDWCCEACEQWRRRKGEWVVHGLIVLSSRRRGKPVEIRERRYWGMVVSVYEN